MNLTSYLIKAAIKSGVPTDAFHFGYRVRNEILHGDSMSGSPQDTRELINSYIPTADEIRDSYPAEQLLQEGVAKWLAVPVPWQVKLAIEAYSLYDYFD